MPTRPPLASAARNAADGAAMVRELLAAGADAAAVSACGRTALHEAASTAVVRELLKAAPATIAAKDHSGCTPLHSLAAVPSVDGESVDILTEAGAVLDAVTRTYFFSSMGTVPARSTALHISAMHGHAAFAQKLLDHGVDTDAVNEWRLTPLDMARNCLSIHIHACAALTKQGGADYPATLTALQRAAAWRRRRHAVCWYYQLADDARAVAAASASTTATGGTGSASGSTTSARACIGGRG